MRVHQDIEPQEQIEGPSDNMNGRLPARDDGSRHVDCSAWLLVKSRTMISIAHARAMH
jgi:hypothetical protein